MIRQDYLIFLQNEEWYYWNEEEWKYKLTDKATKEAQESYKEFYKEDDTKIEED
jgi:hypothetical protein